MTFFELPGLCNHVHFLKQKATQLEYVLVCMSNLSGDFQTLFSMYYRGILETLTATQVLTTKISPLFGHYI